MQHFVIGDLPPEDQKTVRKFYFRMGFGYAAVILLACLLVLVRRPDVGREPAEQAQASPRAACLALLRQGRPVMRCARRAI